MNNKSKSSRNSAPSSKDIALQQLEKAIKKAVEEVAKDEQLDESPGSGLTLLQD